MANGGGVTHAGPTAMQLSRIRQQQARAASYGNYNYQPNVAAITMEDVGRRCMVPTRVAAWDIALGPGTDIVGNIDLAIGIGVGLPLVMWNNQLAADREETYGDTLVGIQVSVQCSIQACDTAAAGGAAGGLYAVDNYADALEQLLYQRYSLAIFPTSGTRSPIVFDTELRAFSPTHRLSGADGYTSVPATPWGDQFSHIDLVVSPPPVVGAYTLFTPNCGVATTDFSIQGTITVAIKKVRGTG
jgi:hypothetical protein